MLVGPGNKQEVREQFLSVTSGKEISLSHQDTDLMELPTS